ncbi:MAG: aminotransferase class I/II-fold pyridoxal phosphate-dependent enzyme [Candidatus Nealsonbacteria bacterium]|nr:aminotransferase class I/II-fold pyridoxal phosphate-dependent enzyme [Candidatus Nealsonbacteria bacterium]
MHIRLDSVSLVKDPLVPEKELDFRSDTVTRPTPEMREAMARAEVGDDVLGDDPTVIRLQERVAEVLGKEAAVYVPSGTMSNLIGVRIHCKPGDEMICEEGCHIFNYEQAGYAQLSGIAARPVEGRLGVLQLEQLEGLIRPDNTHLVRTRLVCLENTHNRGGGTIQPYETVEAICDWAHAAGLRTHLDGARLWHAAAATGIEARQWARHFDTVSVCFSKGLGAPVGSALTGSKELIAEAVRHRKVLGGGMRQSGVIAAAALYAMEHHIERLADDHANARRLAEGIAQIDGLAIQGEMPPTNLLFFRVEAALGTAADFAERIRQRGLLMLATAPTTIRAVTHLDVDANDVERAIKILREVASA